MLNFGPDSFAVSLDDTRDHTRTCSARRKESHCVDGGGGNDGGCGS